MSNLLQAPSRSAIRAELEQLVLGDLHGPAGGPEEELDEGSVSDRYLTGMLAPKRKPVGMELFDELAVAGRGSAEDGKADITTPQAETLIPSSFGMTFCVAANVPALRVTARRRCLRISAFPADSSGARPPRPSRSKAETS